MQFTQNLSHYRIRKAVPGWKKGRPKLYIGNIYFCKFEYIYKSIKTLTFGLFIYKDKDKKQSIYII